MGTLSPKTQAVIETFNRSKTNPWVKEGNNHAKGLKHCPIRLTRIDTPVLFFSGAFDVGAYTRTPTEFILLFIFNFPNAIDYYLFT
jgi:hypothetical protein